MDPGFRACEFIDTRWIESVASFDFAQDEGDRVCHRRWLPLLMQNSALLILSEVEGRTIDMQRPSQPSADRFTSSFAGVTGMSERGIFALKDCRDNRMISKRLVL